jgi:demethylspheroidene O-methyltransferase
MLPEARPASLGGAFRDWRNRLLASPSFHRWALRFAPTRPIVRRRSRQLFDLVAGFVYSQTLYACVRLDLFERLRKGPQTSQTLASETGLSVPAIERLLAAASSLDLLEQRAPACWALGIHGAALLANPSVVAMIEHHALLYEDLSDPLRLLRDETAPTKLSHYWAYCSTDQPQSLGAQAVGAYSALMAASQPLVADQILRAYGFGRHQCLLDVGGGEGRFISSVASAHQGLRGILFDLPEVVARAGERLKQADLASRIRTQAGNFLKDPLPQGADVASIVRVLHDHDDEPVMQLLRSVRAALPRSGTLVVAEPMSGVPGAEPTGDAYFGFYTLAMRRGRPRTHERIAQMMRAAGFERIQRRPTQNPLQVAVLVARCAAVPC